jgi:hypothetical protein
MPPWFIVGLGVAGVAALLALVKGEGGKASGSDAGASGSSEGKFDPASGDVVAPAPPEIPSKIGVPEGGGPAPGNYAPESGYNPYDPGSYYNDPGPAYSEPASGGPPYYLGPSPDNPTGDYVPWESVRPPDPPTVGDPSSSQPIGGGSGTSPAHPILLE